MVRTGSTSSQIAESLNISLRTAQKWIARYEANEDVKTSILGRRVSDRSTMTSNIETIIGSDSALTAKGIIERLPADLQCSPSTISRHIKEMGYTRKRLKPIIAERNSERVISERAIYATHLQNINDDMLVFIDESGFNLHISPSYGYAPLGATPWMSVPTQRGRNVSFIAAITINGLIASQSIIGAFNSINMTDWCRVILLPTLADRSVVFVLDNARFHHSQMVGDILTSTGNRILFLPPYSPQLNPIEQVFSQVKSQYRAYRPRPTTNGELEAILLDISLNLREYSMLEYYRNMREWLIKAQQRVSFI